MMDKDKILVHISNIEDIDKYKKLGISNFLFSLKDYSIGYTSYDFSRISKVDGNIYILVNRLLTDDDIDNFLKLEIPKNIKGFLIEDIGLYYELKNSKFELINFQNHLNNNYATINYWLDRFDSLVISTDITREEIKTILEKSNKKLVLNTFGYPMIMYSRRKLISNFYKHLDKIGTDTLDIDETISSNHFKLKESNFGTSIFDKNVIDYRSLIKEVNTDKIKYYLLNTEFLDFNTIKDVVNGKEIPGSTTGFLDKKTIYKVGDRK